MQKGLEEMKDCDSQKRRNIDVVKVIPYNIFLIGFMGSGKSTVARQLSPMIAMDVIEMDQEIVRRERMSIPDIFTEYGESYFRDLETKLLVEMRERSNVIVSCGGGVALREENVEEMKKSGRVVWLTARPETILERVRNNKERPLLNGNMTIEYIQSMMEKRHTKYAAAAEVIIDTDEKDLYTICEEIIQRLRQI